MSQIDLVDETWIRAPLLSAADAVADGLSWARWFPDLNLCLHQRRGPLGVRWWVAPCGRRRLAGSMEIWLEPSLDGVVLHYFLRLDPDDARPLRPAARRRIERAYVTAAKRGFFELKDQLESAGHPGRGAAPR
jgi:hypothetical protein